MDGKIDTVREKLTLVQDKLLRMKWKTFLSSIKHLEDALAALSAIDSEAKIKRIEELEAELESARKDRRIAWDDANKAEAALSTIDPEAIRRECAYKAKQAILSAPHDNPTRAYAASLAEEAILGAEPAQDAISAQKSADDRAYAWRHEMMGDDEPAQDDGRPEVVMAMIENGDMSISWECSACKGISDDADYIESIEKCPHCGAPIRKFVYIEEGEE